MPVCYQPLELMSANHVYVETLHLLMLHLYLSRQFYVDIAQKPLSQCKDDMF